MREQKDGPPADGATYTYDNVGNRLSKTFVRQADPDPISVVAGYSYDNIHQLTQTLLGGGLSETYSYDDMGNRLSSLGLSPYQYDNSNHLTSTPLASFAYDNSGNTTSKTDASGTTTYMWDYENRLASVSLPGTGTVSFEYDPFGRRIRKVSASATTIYAYDGDNVVEELDAAGNPTARYAQGLGIDEPLAMYRSGTASYYHADGLGSVTTLTDSSGVVAASYVYDSFGNLASSTGSLGNSFRYTGREFDPETGLYYYRARYYDPSVGRFLSEDLVRFAADDNFYRYVANRPTFFTDPLGLFFKSVHYKMTYEVALQEFGPKCEQQAEDLARANEAQDRYRENPVTDFLYNLWPLGKAWKSPGIHFPGPDELSAVDRAIEACDLRLLGQGLHSLQDSLAHAGLEPWQHYMLTFLPDVVASTGPAKEFARQDTAHYLREYKARCLKCCTQ